MLSWLLNLIKPNSLYFLSLKLTWNVFVKGKELKDHRNRYRVDILDARILF